MGKGFDLGGLFRQAQQLQEKIANVQQELAERTVEASAGGGMVTAVVSGKLEVVQLRIEPSLLEKPDADMLRDLVVAAVNEATPPPRPCRRRGWASRRAGPASNPPEWAELGGQTP